MKRIKELSPSSFLKLLFAFFTVAFLVAAVIMPDRGSMFSGLWSIVSQPSKVSTNYFAVGGYAATFLNIGLVCLVCTVLYCLPGVTANNVSTLAFFLTAGFSAWGINVLNIWFTFLGVALYCLVKKEKVSGQINAMLYSTGIAPLITDLMIRYPHGEVVGFTWTGILLALGVGLVIGFFLPAGMAHSPKVHKGYDLYSAAVPVGMTAFFLQAILYKTMGLETPAVPATEALQVASWSITNIFCFVVFGLCIVFALLMGCKPGAYWNLLRDPAHGVDFSKKFGKAAMLMNVGLYGLFIVLYYNIIGATFNAVTFGCIFCMLACCNSGSNPKTVWPIMIGYVAASYLMGWLAGLAGGTFAEGINAQAIVVGLCFANGLSPISGKYGWPFGILAGALHYCLVTSVPLLHGGFCLYNGGFTAAFVALVLVPQLEQFCKTREERRAVRSR